MDQNAWNYTLSAVAQVCAALVAFGGAVITFKLGAIEKNLTDFRDRIIKTILVPLSNVKSDTDFYFMEDNKLVEEINEYKNNNKIIDLNNRINSKIESAILGNYNNINDTKSWIRGTYNSFLALFYTKKDNIASFKVIISILFVSIFLNVFFLSYYLPLCCGAKVIFLLVSIISIIAIIISGYLSWKIFTGDVFDLKNIPENNRNRIFK